MEQQRRRMLAMAEELEAKRQMAGLRQPLVDARSYEGADQGALAQDYAEDDEVARLEEAKLLNQQLRMLMAEANELSSQQRQGRSCSVPQKKSYTHSSQQVE